MTIKASLAILTALGSWPATAQSQWRPVDGYGSLKLGMTFDEALRALPEARWNSYSLQKCNDDMPIRGCLLTQFRSSFAYKIDLIPFSPDLSFNSHGILTDIGLRYDRSGGITQLECRTLFGRAVDYVAREYGPVAYPADGKPFKGAWPNNVFYTPSGARYPVTSNSKGGFFLAGPVRSNLDGVKLPNSAPITKWNNLSYVDVFGHFIVVDKKPNCNFSISFKLPDVVERRTSEQN